MQHVKVFKVFNNLHVQAVHVLHVIEENVQLQDQSMHIHCTCT